ncbi:tetratricopeptide repeat protein [Microcoleus sp. FACHB-68]|uniref:tetratricopeptide repeat protein n=1 Tax=Microcoleus sp. FACHB-68 TaxID=2692826 RepID=UPI00168737C8|nr:tetratricopeptide repeat protein [Microcoleus sp. FACHB-68]MBD1938115.1 tetratricopeptide repeat protein [Microcoleus sp. FACHB-68]
MVQPLPSNSDNDELAKQAGVQQGLDNGSSNSGSMQGASADGDANLANGNNNQFNKVEQQTVIIFPPSQPEVVKPNPSSQKASQVQHIYLVSSAILASFILLSGTTFFYPLFAFRLNGESQMKECTTAKHSNLIKVILADLASSQTSPQLFLKENLLDALQRQNRKDLEICSIEQGVLTYQEAKKIGENLNADIVIWADQNTSYFKISLVAIKINVDLPNELCEFWVPLNSNWNSKSNNQNWTNLFSVMIAVHLSAIYNSKEQLTQARQVLRETLQNARKNIDKTGDEYQKKLGEAYFFLGLLIDQATTYKCDKGTYNDCLEALGAFKDASDFYNKFSEPLFNQIDLYIRLGELDEAINVYTKILENNFDKEINREALNGRAKTYAEKGEFELALRDLDVLCKDFPGDINCLRFLGKTQLQAGKLTEAEITYGKIQRFLEKDKNIQTETGEPLKNELLNDLQAISKQKPDLKINRISAMIE